jgi:hypothetical protein
VTLWEILTHGEQPFKDCKLQEVIRRVRAGERLVQPEGCPADLFAMMSECWCIDRARRPTFASIIERMAKMLEADSGPALRDIGAILNGQLSSQIRTLTIKKKKAAPGMHTLAASHVANHRDRRNGQAHQGSRRGGDRRSCCRACHNC